MVTCSRCDKVYDETQRSTCPLCFTPAPVSPDAPSLESESLAAATPTPLAPTLAATTESAPLPVPGPTPQPGTHSSPQPLAPTIPMSDNVHAAGHILPGLAGPPPTTPQAAPSPAMNGRNVRVSLTGEIIEESPAAPATPPSYVGGTAAPIPPPPRPGMGTDENEVPPNRTAVPMLIVLLVAMVFGGWWLFRPKPDPKQQALSIYTAIAKQDWKGLYPFLALSEEDLKQMPDADTFAQKTQQAINSNPVGKMGMEALKGIKDIQVGEPTINGDKADVPTSATLTFMGQSIKMKGTAHLIQSDGEWKMATGGQQAMQVGQDLIGKPEGMGAAGGPGGATRPSGGR